MEGQGETKLRFYRGLGAFEGTGRDREDSQLRSELRSKSVLGNAKSFPYL